MDSPTQGSTMNIKALLINQLNSGRLILTKGAESLSDQEFHVHLPGPGVSATWVFGHLATNEDWFLSILTGQQTQLPDVVAKQYQDDRSYLQEAREIGRAHV